MNIQWAQFYKLAIMFILALGVVFLFTPFAFPIALGAIFSVIVFPFYKKLLGWKINKILASFVTLVCFSLIFLVPTGLLIYKGASVTAKFVVQTLQNEEWKQRFTFQQQKSIEQIETFSQKMSTKTGLEIPSSSEIIQATVGYVSNFIVSFFRDFFAKIPKITLAMFIAIVTMFFGLVESDRIRLFLLEKSFLSKKRAEKLYRNIINSCRSVIFSNVVTGAVQSMIVALGAHFSGLGNFFVVGFITFIFSFIPMVGTTPVALVLMAYGLLTGHTSGAIAILIVGIVAGTIDNFIRPLLLSGAVEIHPFFSLLAILGGVILLGLPGLIIGPLVLAISMSCIPIYYEDYRDNMKSR